MSKRVKEIIVRYDDKQSFIYGNTLGEVVGELVRCKECRRSYIEGQTTLYRVCGLHDITTDENNYCSWGER